MQHMAFYKAAKALEMDAIDFCKQLLSRTDRAAAMNMHFEDILPVV